MIASIFISILAVNYIIGIIYLILNSRKFEAEIGMIIFLALYFIFELIYFISFQLSTEVFFDIPISSIFWYISIITRNISIGMFASMHNLELNKKSKIRFLPALIYIFIGGIIFSILLVPNSFTVIIIGIDYYYMFNNIGLLLSINLFSFCIVFISWIIQIKGYHNFADKKLGNFYNIFYLLFSSHILFYNLFIIFPNIYFKIVYSVLYLISLGYFVNIAIQKPNLLAVFTNKIYDFIVFHKSGILLYSYNFETREEVDESLLKGSILIGISHILANLSNVESQVTHIKMKERAVVFNFNTELGYATLLIAKHRNKILEKCIDNFMDEFSSLNKDTLQNLTGLVDVSMFINAKSLIKLYFRHFLTEK